MTEQTTMSPQEAIKAVRDLKDLVERKMPEVEAGLQSEREVRVEFEKRLVDIQKAIEDMRANALPPANPLAALEEKVLQQRGTLFHGQMRLPYGRAMKLLASHPVVRQQDRQQLQELQDLNDAVVMRYWRGYLENKTRDKGDLLNEIAGSDDFKSYFLAMARAGYVRANEVIHPGSSGIGANLNFTLLSAQLFERIRMEADLMEPFQVLPLPRASVDFPVELTDALGVLGGNANVPVPATDATQVTGVPVAAGLSNPTFGQISFRCVHLLGFLLWNDDMFEDSAVPWLPIMRQQVGRSIGRAINAAIFNGTRIGTTHIDDDVTTAVQDCRYAWHGIRKLSKTNMISQSGAKLDLTGLRDLRASMGMYARTPSDLFYIIHMNGWFNLMRSGDLTTVDKTGDVATIRSGVLATVDNIPVKMNEAVRTNLNASGKWDGVTTTRTVAACVNKTRFFLGQCGDTRVEETRYAPQLSTVIQADVRCDFKSIEAPTASTNTEYAAGVTPCNVLYNVLA